MPPIQPIAYRYFSTGFRYGALLYAAFAPAGRDVLAFAAGATAATPARSQAKTAATFCP